MHGEEFLQDLAIVMIVAGLVTIVFHQFKQPVVLGYIIAGVIIGPHTPPYKLIHDEHTIQALSEIGIIFLMFGLGLHFSLRKLAKVGATALIGATLEILVMSLLGYLVGRSFGWSKMDSIFLGALLSISSTTIIIKALEDLGKTKEKFADLIFGILIVEDILAIAMLALLSGIAKNQSLNAGEVVLTLGKLTIFLAVVLVVGLLTVPFFLRYIARFKSNEMLLIAVLGLCFGVSLLTLKLGYSVALGAFLIGAIIAEAREVGKIETLIDSIRDMFSAVFFVSIGLLIDPKLLVQYWLPIVVITIIVVVGKVIACGAGTFLAGHDTRTSLRVGMAVSQIGEFSFIIAQLGLTLGVTSDFLYPIAVTVSGITTLLTPYLIKASDPLVATFDRHAPRAVSDYLQSYSGWVAGLGDRKGGNVQIRRLMRKWMLQIGLNLALITGLFIVGVWLANRSNSWQRTMPRWTGGARGIVWLAAVLVALPILIATFRKIRAFANVLAEMSIRRGKSREHTDAQRAAMAGTILLASFTAIVLWILLLTSTILPPWPVLLVLALVIVAVAVTAWRWMIRVYAKAQIALTETLTQVHPVHVPPRTMPPLLQSAKLETIVLPPESIANKKLIRELQLRTLTGASVVGIERAGGEQVINPGPDEELLAADSVLLIGTEEQLRSARRLLTEAASSS